MVSIEQTIKITDGITTDTVTLGYATVRHVDDEDESTIQDDPIRTIWGTVPGPQD